MRRFLTLVTLLCLAVPAGISISGCVRNPAAKYCPETPGYGILKTAVYSIILQPQVAGISLAYGQTIQAQAPQAYNCLNSTVSVSSKTYQYGTYKSQLVDISPTGNICAGTWNRNTGGGIADYTYCYYPNPLPSTNGLPYGIGYIYATADSVTSNAVAVYVHAPITSISLVGPPQCQSQGSIAQLDAAAYYDNNGTQTLLCAPGSTSVPDCESSIGTMNFTVGTSSVASINSTTNQITAEQPGTTAITASIAGSGSSAGYFSTCPPMSISVKLANGSTSGSIAQGTPQNLTTLVTDTNGQTISGLSLTYQSTQPIDITTGSGGAISTSFPGAASLTAICQPSSCNPAPINEIGLNGTGLPISSNPVNITVPGTASEYAWFSSPGLSQYFVPIELLTGTVGSNVRLPYVPNSMVMDRAGVNLFFGSARELMIYSTSTSTLTKQDTTAPGVVLAASPSDSQLLINDQARQLFYLYSVSGGTSITFGGMGVAAAWTPDSQTLYIYDNAQFNTLSNPACSTPLVTGHSDTLYVYNANTGWTVEALPPSPPLPPGALPSCTAEPNTALPIMAQTPAITVPSVGAYLPGSDTVAHTWCPGSATGQTGTVGNNASIQFYPEDPMASDVTVPSDVLGASVDGKHILAATESGGNISLADIGVTIPTTACPETTTGSGTSQVQTLAALSTDPMLNGLVTLNGGTGMTISAVNQVVTGATPTTAGTSTAQGIAFFDYTSSSTSGGAELPYYLPAAGGTGTASMVTLSDCPPTTSTGATNPAYPCNASIQAPLVGAFSPDDTTFFVSTAGDNEIHYISIPPTITGTTVPADVQQISPDLPACLPVANGGVDAGCVNPNPSATIVPAMAIAVKPRSVT